ncbi:MAG: 6,7-dimethyl-8-ribityllumazine synthase [Bacteroidota bacterium]
MSSHIPENISSTGILIKKDAFVVIIRTEWNAEIVNELENGCKKILDDNNIPFEVINVPGAVEISFAIKNYFDNKSGVKPSAFIALGCVLRGDTPHFDYVCQSVTNGILQLNLLLPVPSIFGILTVDTEQQAIERIGGGHGHKGEEAALTALKMIMLSDTFKS